MYVRTYACTYVSTYITCTDIRVYIYIEGEIKRCIFYMPSMTFRLAACIWGQVRFMQYAATFLWPAWRRRIWHSPQVVGLPRGCARSDIVLTPSVLETLRPKASLFSQPYRIAEIRGIDNWSTASPCPTLVRTKQCTMVVYQHSLEPTC